MDPRGLALGAALPALPANGSLGAAPASAAAVNAGGGGGTGRAFAANVQGVDLSVGDRPQGLAQSCTVNIAAATQLGFAVAAAVGVFSFVRTAQDGELRRSCTPLCEVRPQYAAQNRLAPSFELPKLSGGHARFSDYAGKTVVMNFWTKNCGPCLEEMPSLARFATTLKARKDAVFLSVCTDDTVEDAKQTLSTVLPEGIPFEVLLDPDAKVVTELYGTKLYPETWFIDPSGVIRARIDGARDYSQPLFVELVESLSANPSCNIEFNRGAPRGENAWLCATPASP